MQIVCISWVIMCLQFITLMAFTRFYDLEKLKLPFASLSNQWKADCRS